MKQVEVDGVPCTLDIMDTAGQEEFGGMEVFLSCFFFPYSPCVWSIYFYLFIHFSLCVALRDQYMKTGEGFLVVYSITTLTTFEAVTKFHSQILRVQEDKQDIPIVIVGNKKDLEDDREV